MNVGERPTGSEPILENVLCPNWYAVHSTMVSGPDPNTPAIPTVLVELEGWTRDQLPLDPRWTELPPTTKVTVLLEVPGAEGIAAGILNSLGQLKRLARNQEGPRS